MKNRVKHLNRSTYRPQSQIGFGLTAVAVLLPCCISAAACLGLNLWYALFTAVICAILSAACSQRLLVPSTFGLLPAVFLLSVCGLSSVPFALVGGALLFFLFTRKPFQKFKLPPSVLCGILLGLSFSATVWFTAQYFGIFATGKTVLEMLKSYRSLGFHPNWDGLLYGTITLFAMITFPFKFKKSSRFVPEEFFSLALPFLLSLLLVPDPSVASINELGSLSNFLSGFSVKTVLPFLSGIGGSFSVLYIIKAAFCFAVILLLCRPAQKNDVPGFAVSNALTGVGGGFALEERPIRGYTPLSAVTAVLVLSVVFFFCPSLLARIPMHSLGVILICNGWKKVNYASLGKVFKGTFWEKAVTVLIFLGFLFFDLFAALLIGLVFAFVIRRVTDEK